MELVIIIVAVFVQAMLAQGRAVNIIGTLTVWRFIVCFLGRPLDSLVTKNFFRWVLELVVITLPVRSLHPSMPH